VRHGSRSTHTFAVHPGSTWRTFSRHARYGGPPKSLLLAPERLLWAKANPMPSSVGDRLSLTYEVVHFLVRSR